jgi:NAD(P)-dependent dehydrogenase (short-subunit alcohol dehydrogenase family)
MKNNKSKSLKDLFSMKNKKVLIIGGAGYLGKAMTSSLMELGASVVVSSRNKKKGELEIKKIKQKNNKNIIFYPVDITSQVSINKLKDFVSKRFNNQLDVLINCGWSGKKNTFESINNEDWQYDIETCLTGVFKTTKIFLPLLKKKRGNILNIGSAYSHVAPDYRMYDSPKYSNPPSYGAAKAGVVQLTKYCASFFSKYKIRVNCISPGAYPFPKTIKENPKFIKRLAEKCPANRIGYPDDLKGVVALLCSDAGSFITGQNILVDGGWSVW